MFIISGNSWSGCTMSYRTRWATHAILLMETSWCNIFLYFYMRRLSLYILYMLSKVINFLKTYELSNSLSIFSGNYHLITYIIIENDNIDNIIENHFSMILIYLFSIDLRHSNTFFLFLIFSKMWKLIMGKKPSHI